MELLKWLSESPGVSGDENLISDFIADKVYGLCDEMFKDNMGNLYCFKKGTSGKHTILLAAHMDEVGLIISSVTDDGFLKFRIVGGIDESVLLAKRVRIGKNKVLGVTGIKAVHLSSKEEIEKKVSYTDMYIDIGVKNKDEALKLVNVGDYAVFDTDYEKMGRLLKGKALDDRLGCRILMTLMEKSHKSNVWFCFTVQEELGLRGAAVISRRLKADKAVVIDCTTCIDFPGIDKEKTSTKIGEGPAITIVDGATYPNISLRKELEQSADKFQYKNVNAGGNDAGAIHLNNIKTAAVSIPTRYIHSPVSAADWSDAEECIKMFDNFLNTEEF